MANAFAVGQILDPRPSLGPPILRWYIRIMAASTFNPFARPGASVPNPLAGRPSDSSLAASPLANLAFRLTLVYIVMLVGRVPEITSQLISTSLYQVLVVSVILLALAVITGDLIKVGSTRMGAMWIAFHLWVVFSLPFSGYRRGSFEVLQPMLLYFLSVFFLGGFLTLSVDALRKGFCAMSWAGVVGLAWMQYTGVSDESERFASIGTFGNSNLLAIYLLIMIPFWSAIILNRRYLLTTRIFFVAAIGLGLVSILKTGSRSGFMTIGILSIPMFLSLKLANKFKFVAVAAVAIIGVLAWAPEGLKSRWATVFRNEAHDAAAAGAITSSDARYALLIESLQTTFKHPILGVGIGVYADVAAQDKKGTGVRALWQVTHNMYTEISAETGIPGFILYFTAMYWAVKELWKIKKQTRGDPQLRELNLMSRVLLYGYLVFCFNGLFTSMATEFLMYVLSGFSIATILVYQQVLRQKSSGNQAPAEFNRQPLRSPRFFPQPAQLPAPAPAVNVPAVPQLAGKYDDAPWRRNPRKYPPKPGTPGR
jgi:O-antigen ligase